MQIVIETDRKLVIRRRGAYVPTSWCAACAKQVSWVTPEEAVLLVGLSSRVIYQRVETGLAHYSETPEGFLYVCLDSLSTPQAAGLVTIEPLVNRAADKARVPRQAQPAWEPDQTSFTALLARLDSDPERAAQRYIDLRERLAKFFECRGCHAPLDLADQTCARVERRLSEGEEIRSSDPTPYFYGVARNVLREYQEDRERQFLPLDDLPPTDHPSLDPHAAAAQQAARRAHERRLEYLESCLQELPAEARRLLLDYYHAEKRARIDGRKELAERMGITVNALKLRVFRLRATLERRINERVSQGAAA